ncbi:hypothetical protein BOW53_14660 [Solemya pervernicosa gill symbiont]|uniref:Uncharacterized protein n=2 Tax=Solemya pervernicosa gill symbiont TaxID=642797 RepID=A0A1T2L0Q7_9GAMM|nr:hypothetical protein BOW53_14660 [Solemya pervernicosa gill symbiont]
MACSPHPGAANWHVAEETRAEIAAEFARIEVDFEGRATIFAAVEEGQAVSHDLATAGRRCFWGGVDAQTVGLTCALAADSAIEEHYMLRVSSETGMADLIQDGVVLGQFVRQP